MLPAGREMLVPTAAVFHSTPSLSSTPCSITWSLSRPRKQLSGRGIFPSLAAMSALRYSSNRAWRSLLTASPCVARLEAGNVGLPGRSSSAWSARKSLKRWLVWTPPVLMVYSV